MRHTNTPTHFPSTRAITATTAIAVVPASGPASALARWRAPALGAITVGAGLGALAVGAVLAYTRIPTQALGPQPQPAPDYEAALRRLEEFDAGAGAPLNPLCRSQLLTHGRQTDAVIVLFHGLTNCPYQFLSLGETLRERGYNVLIPRMPRNGLKDRERNHLERLSAEELRAYADTAVDVACGLGRRVCVAGISAGGVIAGWAAQFRPEVAQATLIAPSFGFGGRLGERVGPLEALLLGKLPSFRLDRFGKKGDILAHAYLNFPSRALGEVMRLGLAVTRAARHSAPVAGSIAFVVNPCDNAVNDDMTLALARRWAAAGGPPVAVIELEASWRLIHDIVDPAQPQQQTTRVYPLLLDLLTR